jgi:hypothetical protein
MLVRVRTPSGCDEAGGTGSDVAKLDCRIATDRGRFTKLSETGL